MPHPKNQALIQCYVCGQFKSFKVSIVKKNRKFCTNKCYGKYASKKYIGANSRGWKGGRTLSDRGYWMLKLPNHPNANSNGYVPEHRFIASNKIGRTIKKIEDVHHMDGNKQNNHPDNLEVLLHGQHTSKGWDKRRKFTKSKLKWIYYDKSKKKWRVQIGFNFNTKKEAILRLEKLKKGEINL